MIDKLEESISSLIGTSLSEIRINKSSKEMSILFDYIISKMSPLIGNLVELKICSHLDEGMPELSQWVRQDPDFPDVVSSINPEIGVEVKVWYPFSTEITGRFKESQSYLQGKEMYLAIFAWDFEPVQNCHDEGEWLSPFILDGSLIPCQEIAASRDMHYHKPPRYLVVEPLDTTARTRNLQQRNVEGYRLQADEGNAKKIMNDLGMEVTYSMSDDYQDKIQRLQSSCRYRLDTNFAKLDRIRNDGIESFKSRVINTLNLRQAATAD